MSVLKFFGTLIGVKAGQAVTTLQDAVVRLDPKAATEAQIREMESAVDKASQLLATYRSDLKREKVEAETAEKKYDTMFQAAQRLDAKLNDPATSEAEKATIGKSLEKLLSDLEGFKVELDREVSDVKHAEEMVAAAEAALRSKSEQLASARTELKRAEKDLERAKMDAQRAADEAQRARELAGLQGEGGSTAVTAAIDSFRRQADEARTKAEAARAKADAIKGTTSDADPVIAAAMKEVEAGATTKGSVSDRLSALKR